MAAAGMRVWSPTLQNFLLSFGEDDIFLKFRSFSLRLGAKATSHVSKTSADSGQSSGRDTQPPANEKLFQRRSFLLTREQKSGVPQPVPPQRVSRADEGQLQRRRHNAVAVRRPRRQRPCWPCVFFFCQRRVRIVSGIFVAASVRHGRRKPIVRVCGKSRGGWPMMLSSEHALLCTTPVDLGRRWVAFDAAKRDSGRGRNLIIGRRSQTTP